MIDTCNTDTQVKNMPTGVETRQEGDSLMREYIVNPRERPRGGCRGGGDWASNRFRRLRWMRLSAAPKGTGWNDSGTQRMENYFYFAGAGAVADPGDGGGT